MVIVTGIWLIWPIVNTGVGGPIATVRSGAVATSVVLITCVVDPAGLLAVTVSVCGPAVSVTGQANVPDTLAVVEQSVTGPGPVITTVLPGVAVPLTTVFVGVVLPETGLFTVRLGGPTAVKLSTTGVELPPGLLATAVTEAGPAGNVRAEVEKTPVGSAVTLTGPPTLPGPPVRVTTAFGVAVPEMVGVVVAVPLVVGDRIATVGTGRAVTLIGTLVVPPGPEAVTVRVVGPAVTLTGQLKVPDIEAVVVQSVVLPGPVITIGLPGVAVPVIGWVVPPGVVG